MPPRSSWKGFLRLSLVSVPVKAFTASNSGGEIRLNQLHRDCNSPIKYRKVCPIHGEVANDSIVSGYQYAKGQYVVIDPEEVKKLRRESDKAIAIDGFFPAETVDPIYFTTKNYYLVPDGPVGNKPYALLHRAMVEEGLHATGQIVLSGKEQTALLRPYEKLILMTMLSFEGQVKKASAFDDELTEPDVSAAELKLTKTLIEATTLDEFDISRYKDEYTAKLTELIESKVAGKEIVVVPPAEEPQVIDLMEALKQSVARAQETGAEKEGAARKTKKKSAKKMAPSARARGSAKRKKQSG